MRKGQGAVEYIIILGVIILIALIVVSSLGGLGIFQFSSSAQARTTEISNQLADVSFTYVVGENGSVQTSIKSTTYKRIIADSMTWYDATGTSVCEVDFVDSTVRQNFVSFSNSSCTGLAGSAGENYDFDCTVRYTDSNDIYHQVRGTCEGFYEE